MPIAPQGVGGGAGSVALHERGVAGLCVHPHRAQLVSWGEEGAVKSWV
jgi:hypothetical protein